MLGLELVFFVTVDVLKASATISTSFTSALREITELKFW
jgi:hypothetical protein